jgi:hypothetical protein
MRMLVSGMILTRGRPRHTEARRPASARLLRLCLGSTRKCFLCLDNRSRRCIVDHDLTVGRDLGKIHDRTSSLFLNYQVICTSSMRQMGRFENINRSICWQRLHHMEYEEGIIGKATHAALFYRCAPDNVSGNEPLCMERPGHVQSFVCVSTEIVALGLNQVGRERVTPVGVVVSQAGAERRGR